MKVAIYCRLSAEDRDKSYAEDDSESIQNQKAMLIKYASKNGWTIYDIYSDHDYAGTDRRRPEFNRLMTKGNTARKIPGGSFFTAGSSSAVVVVDHQACLAAVDAEKQGRGVVYQHIHTPMLPDHGPMPFAPPVMTTTLF